MDFSKAFDKVDLTLIFNLSLDTGVVPIDWRTADVVPVYKKGSKSNYIVRIMMYWYANQTVCTMVWNCVAHVTSRSHA